MTPRVHLFGLLTAACLFALPAGAAGTAADGPASRPAAVLSFKFVYDRAPFRSAHASTVVATRAGGLVYAYFGGTAEGNKDVCVWVSRHEGSTWVPPTLAYDGRQADGSRFPCWNPVLHVLKDGRLVLFYKVGPKPTSWWGMVGTSDYGGRTWSPPARLPDGFLGPIKDKPIDLPDGRLLCPSSTEGDDCWRVHMEFATPPLAPGSAGTRPTTAPVGPTALGSAAGPVPAAAGGWTFTKTGPLCDGRAFGLIQPTLLRPAGGGPGGDRLLALCRSRGLGRIVALSSADAGLTWSAPVATDLPNPNSGIDGVTLADGRSLLVYNHTPRGRSPLNVAVSADGKAWAPAVTLESEPGEYSYPAVVQVGDGRVHITYTWKRQKVRHVVLDPAKL